MVARRSPSIRGRIARGENLPSRGRKTRNTPLPTPEPVEDPTKPRAVIDFSLQRSADLKRFHRGGALTSDFCEADPYLLKAAKFHGEHAGRACPACKSEDLVELRYIYGDELGPYAGRIRKAAELDSLCSRFGEFKVYVVEVCQRCHWNYMIKQFTLGDGQPRRALPAFRSGEVYE